MIAVSALTNMFRFVLREHTGDALVVTEKVDAICSAMFDAAPDRETDVTETVIQCLREAEALTR